MTRLFLFDWHIWWRYLKSTSELLPFNILSTTVLTFNFDLDLSNVICETWHRCFWQIAMTCVDTASQFSSTHISQLTDKTVSFMLLPMIASWQRKHSNIKPCTPTHTYMWYMVYVIHVVHGTPSWQTLTLVESTHRLPSVRSWCYFHRHSGTSGLIATYRQRDSYWYFCL